jgi:hypothetical protein
MTKIIHQQTQGKFLMLFGEATGTAETDCKIGSLIKDDFDQFSA